MTNLAYGLQHGKDLVEMGAISLCPVVFEPDANLTQVGIEQVTKHTCASVLVACDECLDDFL